MDEKAGEAQSVLVAERECEQIMHAQTQEQRAAPRQIAYAQQVGRQATFNPPRNSVVGVNSRGLIRQERKHNGLCERDSQLTYPKRL